MSPEPHRALFASLVSYLVKTVQQHMPEWRQMGSSVGMKKGTSLEHIRILVPLLEAELKQNTLEKGLRWSPPEHGNRAQQGDSGPLEWLRPPNRPDSMGSRSHKRPWGRELGRVERQYRVGMVKRPTQARAGRFHKPHRMWSLY